jgi:ParB-like chromosome segregation protein Spo0J
MTSTTIGYRTTTKELAPTALKALHVHRYAGIFRPVEGDELDKLRDSIRAGYDASHPIVVWAQTGEIVDGRNRRDVALEVGAKKVPAVYVDFPDDDEVRRFIVQQNLARRHLTTKERAALAGQLVVNGASVRAAAKSAGVSKDTELRGDEAEAGDQAGGGRCSFVFTGLPARGTRGRDRGARRR